MGKPAKIRKKKSFMFTTRHYSFMSILGIMIAVFCACVVTTMIIYSYNVAGKVEIGYGGIGMFALILNIIGVICGVVSLGERDVYISAAIVAIVLNGIEIFGWLTLMIISIVMG